MPEEMKHSPEPWGYEWRPIQDFPGYEVSNYGEIKSMDRKIIITGGRVRPQKTILMRTSTDKDGYKKLMLSLPGKRKKVSVHSIVAATFIGPRPKGLVINHINKNPADNKVSNLEYITQKENVAHSIENYRGPSRKSVIRISDGRLFESTQDAARNSVCSQAHVSSVCNGKPTGDFKFALSADPAPKEGGSK